MGSSDHHMVNFLSCAQVRWSGEHVPGSPFVTMIFDTEEELARSTVILNFILNPHCQVKHQPSSKMFCRFLQGGYSPAGQANQSEFYGSIGLQSLSLNSLFFLTKISQTLFFLWFAITAGPYSSHYGNITFPTGTMQSWGGSQANINWWRC